MTELLKSLRVLYRIAFLLVPATVFAQAIVLAQGTVFAQGTVPPNIVFLISDDHAWTDYGFMGHRQIETPNLDRLARRSAVFTRGYVPTALCRPALATLITGLYAHQHQISGNDPALLPEVEGKPRARGESDEYRVLREKLISKIDRHPLLPKLLAQKEYLSHQSGKWWEGNYRRGGFTHGMTRGFPQPGGRHGDDGLKIGREGMQPVIEFIDHAVAEKRPFFAWYAPFLPHSPHTPPQRLFDKYKAKGIESDHVARYYAMVEWFDETCGQLLDHLQQKGLADNTLVVYIGDNGWIQDPNGPGFAPRSKQSANEGGTRQPTMFSWPGVIRPGDRGQQLCSSVDIVPTALAAAGLDIPKEMPGFNLMPVLKSGEPTSRREVFGETFAHDIADIDKPEASLLYRWVIDGKWKLLLTYDGKTGRYAKHHPQSEKQPQLYDLMADPHEDRNVTAEHPEVVANLAGKIQAWWPVTERKVQTKLSSSAKKKPNVLFVAIDDLRTDLGVMGVSHARTPQLDAFARSARLFNHHYVQVPTCGASRCALLSGRYPSLPVHISNNAIRNTQSQWSENSLPAVFRRHGYQTLALGKISHYPGGRTGKDWSTGPEELPGAWTRCWIPDAPWKSAEAIMHGYANGVARQPGSSPPWQAVDGPDETYPDAWVATEAIATLKGLAANEDPWFFSIGFFKPHLPFAAPKRWHGLHTGGVPDLSPDIAARPTWPSGWHNSGEFRGNYGHEANRDPETDVEYARRLREAYAGCVSYMDAQVGRVLDELRRLHLDDNTVVVVWSDHGFLLGEHAIWGKHCLYENALRSPLMIRVPGLTAPGQASDAIVETVDLLPTLAELCELELPEGLSGRSLRPQLNDPAVPSLKPALGFWTNGQRTIRTDRWRLIVNGKCERAELFDYQSDPHETRNHAGENPAIVTKLLKQFQ